MVPSPVAEVSKWIIWFTSSIVQKRIAFISYGELNSSSLQLGPEISVLQHTMLRELEVKEVANQCNFCFPLWLAFH